VVEFNIPEEKTAKGSKTFIERPRKDTLLKIDPSSTTLNIDQTNFALGDMSPNAN
jgi:hypothetical protein